MKKVFAKMWWLLKETFSQWSDDRAQRLAAALAYYTVFSLAPLLIIVTGIVGLVFKPQEAQGQIYTQIESLVGHDSAIAIQGLIRNASVHKGSTSLITTLVGFLTLLFGAAGVFVELQDSLNFIWRVEPKKLSGIKAMFRHRFLTFAMILGIGFLLIVSLVVSTALAAITKYLGHFVGNPSFLWELVNFGISLGVLTALFAMIFKILPDREIAWRDVWMGSFLTGLLFTLGKTLIGIYLGRSGVATVYGAAGSLALVLLWVYYSSQIIYLGAEFTHVYAERKNDGTVKADSMLLKSNGAPASKVKTARESSPYPGYVT